MILIFPLIYVVSVLPTHQDVLEELQRENMDEPAPALLEAANNRLKRKALE